MQTPFHSEITDINEETQSLNTENAWLQHLQGGPPHSPYLKTEKRLKKWAKNQHGKRVKPPVSTNQRRIANG